MDLIKELNRIIEMNDDNLMDQATNQLKTDLKAIALQSFISYIDNKSINVDDNPDK